MAPDRVKEEKTKNNNFPTVIKTKRNIGSAHFIVTATFFFLAQYSS